MIREFDDEECSRILAGEAGEAEDGIGGLGINVGRRSQPETVSKTTRLSKDKTEKFDYLANF